MQEAVVLAAAALLHAVVAQLCHSIHERCTGVNAEAKFRCSVLKQKLL
jgi:hypothetical protein